MVRIHAARPNIAGARSGEEDLVDIYLIQMLEVLLKSRVGYSHEENPEQGV